MYAYSGASDFYFFIYYLLSPVILFLGLTGNLLALVVLKRKVMNKIGPLLMHFFLFVFDTLYLLLVLIQGYLSRGFGINLLHYSWIGCKIYHFSVHSLAPISPLVIIYISLDRFVSLKFPTRRLYLKRNKEQLISIGIFILFNLLYKIPILITYDISVKNTTQTCTMTSVNSRFIITYMDVGFRIAFISIAMIIITILIIYCIYQSRRRVMHASTTDNRTVKRDIRLSVTSLIINFIYIILNMPLNFTSFYSGTIPDYSYIITMNLFYLSYSINFYIVTFSNSLFRGELIKVLKLDRLDVYLTRVSNAVSILKYQQNSSSRP